MASAQDSLSFGDVAVGFPWEDWQLLDPTQKDLYKDVMLENYSSLASAGCLDTKPDPDFKVEQGEQSWPMEGAAYDQSSPESTLCSTEPLLPMVEGDALLAFALQPDLSLKHKDTLT
ncbi:KRAB domain-containing protein 4-like isoform X2 [Tenrec ecaudatus]|uniref:KRAB domain-containing protein 4-like isoform X2 n=1 Tax=Tenrec ecaudatus TaxID=94439 RepID=UPI003F592758